MRAVATPRPPPPPTQRLGAPWGPGWPDALGGPAYCAQNSLSRSESISEMTRVASTGRWRGGEGRLEVWNFAGLLSQVTMAPFEMV
jgi:hypothetical protein